MTIAAIQIYRRRTRSALIVGTLIASWLIGGWHAVAVENWGRFNGEIVAKFLSDGRNMQIERPFEYIDPNDRNWDVPTGATTDGASVPRFFWIAFPPFTGKYRGAAVVHDYYCQTKTRSWIDTHETFYTAMRASGVDEITSKALYGAVYAFGPRWGIGTKMRGPAADSYRSDEQQEAFFRDLKTWIAKENPSLQDINKQLDKGIAFVK